MNPATVDIHGAAELMKVHAKTVLDLIGAGVLPAARVGRAYVLLTKDVLAHIEDQIIAQTAARMGVPGRRKRQLERGKEFERGINRKAARPA